MATSLYERYFKTVSLCCSYFVMGMVLSIIGPTILELQCLLHVSYVDVVKVLPARMSGWVLGSLVVGIFHDRLNPISTLMVALAVMGICVILMPWTNSLYALLALAFIGCSGGGVIGNNATVLLLYMWGKESQLYMQALHFCFGLGSLVAPLLASPFLSAGDVPVEGLPSDTDQEGGLCIKGNVSIRIPYAIIGSASLALAIVFAYLFCFSRQTDEHPSRLDKKDSVGGAKVVAWKKNMVLTVAGLFLFTLLGLEIGMGSFATSFAVKSDNHLSKRVGAYMTSLYWFTYTFFRLFALLFINRISISLNIALELGILVLANIILVPFGNSSEWCLWVGVALIGIGTSTLNLSSPTKAKTGKKTAEANGDAKPKAKKQPAKKAPASPKKARSPSPAKLSEPEEEMAHIETDAVAEPEPAGKQAKAVEPAGKKAAAKEKPAQGENPVAKKAASPKKAANKASFEPITEESEGSAETSGDKPPSPKQRKTLQRTGLPGRPFALDPVAELSSPEELQKKYEAEHAVVLTKY
ncbi:Major facilitator superfamily domain-containing protein 4A [Halotydeus destructor]|nr:Major facilitator superfamily domain-containing protein 4A [Halotydeus destructor]